MYDMHIHTDASHDCRQTIDEVCLTAIRRGLNGIAICNHADMGPCDVPNSYEEMCKCVVDVAASRKKYNLDILQGIEMAEYVYDPEKGKKMLGICNYDVILGSVHYVKYKDIDYAYSKVDFGSMSEDDVKGFLDEYFLRVTEMIEKTEFDVLAHLTCPIRYINGKYGKNIDIMEHREQIQSILDMIVERSIALEINTSGIGTGLADFMPHKDIVQMYAKAGGRLVTISSDAHVPDRIGTGLEEAKKMLKEADFDTYCYYKGRAPQFIKL
ncbi:MAG: histidinol-phosphatase HisJ family protein [Clostridia bacterium]|nr:histidinol-phosphatase HisJ family protein [Clostridia bacterium]